MHVPFLNSFSLAHSSKCIGPHSVVPTKSRYCKFQPCWLWPFHLGWCSSAWESISYPTSCLAGFLHCQCEFFPPSWGPHGPRAMSAFLTDYWTFHPLPSLLTNFSSIRYAGKTSLPSPLSLFSPLVSLDEKTQSFLWSWCSLTICLGSRLQRGEEGTGWRSTRLLWWEEGHLWALRLAYKTSSGQI